ncbi:MAG: GAF domain-containing protein [Pelosinus sp.]|nr:GAF domain-containing protein [Pelosinus sp.]
MNQNTESQNILQAHNCDYYLNLFESANDAIFVEKLDGHIVDVNSAACQLLQYTRQELLQMNASDLLPPNMYQETKKILQTEGASAGQSFIGCNIRKDGVRLHVETMIRDFWQNGEQFLLVIVRDISERLVYLEKEKYQQFLESLHQMSLELLNQFDLPTLFTKLLKHTSALFNTGNAYIGLLHEQSLQRVAGLGLYETLADYPFKLGEGLIGKVAETGAPLIIADYETWPGRLLSQDFSTFKGGAAMPLKSDTKTIGVICFGYADKTYNFSLTDLQFLQQFAELASLAIVNASLHTTLLDSQKQLQDQNANLTAMHEELQASEEELRQQFDELFINEGKIHHQNQILNSLHDISLSLMNRLDLNDTLKMVVDSATKLVNTEHGFIYLIDEESGLFERKIGQGIYAKDIGRKTKCTDGLVGKIFDTGKLMVIDNYSTWENRLPHPFFDNLHSIIQVPLKIDKQVIGTFGVALDDPLRKFTQQEIDVLCRLAEMAAVALDNAALITSYKKEICERRQTEKALRFAEENNQQLINALPDNLVILNHQGIILDFRGNSQHLLFLSRNSIGKNITDLIPSDLATQVLHYTKEALKANVIQVFESQASVGAQINYYETRIMKSGKAEEVLAIIRDMTEKVLMEKHVAQLSLCDALTGLYNRAFFKNEMPRFGASYPAVGFLVCDIDGLKFINDSLGNTTGDNMLITVGAILKSTFSKTDVIARIGGDEFAVLLSPASLEHIDELCQNIKSQIERYNIENSTIPISLSIGLSASHHPPFDMDSLLTEADNTMYREKLHRQKSTRSAIVQALLKALEARDFITEGHGDRLQSLMESFATALGIPGQQIADLLLFSQFHDIGKVGIPDQILFKPAKLTDEEFTVMRQHSEIGYNIAKSAPDLVPIANWIFRHHEWWNGEGYPFGLSGQDIPLPCRMLSIIDAFDAMTNDRPYRKALPYEHALKELQRFAGSQFDPELVEPFVKLVKSELCL